MPFLCLRLRSNRIIVLTFLTLCLLIALSSLLPPDHPAHSHIRTALSYDALKKVPWREKRPHADAETHKPNTGLHVDHRPHIIGQDARTSHRYRENGHLQVNTHGPHPIYELVQRAEKEWKVKNDKASRTIKDAAAEYKRRYGRSPPKGFDKWWTYVTAHRVPLPDEYDRIHQDLQPFWGVDPSLLRAAQAAREREKGTYTIACANGKVSVAVENFDKSDPVRLKKIRMRAEGQVKLLQRVQQYLPDFRATFNALDTPHEPINYELNNAALQAAKDSKVLDSKKKYPAKVKGWSASCSSSSPMGQGKGTKRPDPKSIWSKPNKYFVHDHKLTMDTCLNPSNVHLNGFLQASDLTSAPRDTLVPSFSVCSTSLHSDILGIPTEDWEEDLVADPPWSNKAHSKIYWRGNNTGTFHGPDNWWNLTQRIRFVSSTTDKDTEIWVLPSTQTKYEPVSGGERVEKGLLNEEWVDARFTGSPMLCESGKDKTCEDLARLFEFVPAEPAHYEKEWKFLIDIDGNACSTRFKRLMTTRGLVLKSTIHSEWYSDRIQPWVHYVPVRYDYTDLYDIMAFFKGDVDGQGGHGHDELAATIGAAGRRWSLTHYRKEDMTAYLLRLFLEYARVMSPERQKMNFEA
ncbi:Glycosyltransferase Family 90 domain containing protein [Tulasnella sp. 403]|nr:Glycosyltransferase Family 90 domain containing protein [Tulasnella sp. 403]